MMGITLYFLLKHLFMLDFFITKTIKKQLN